MEIQYIQELLNTFKRLNEPLIGHISLTLSQKIDIAIFPDELSKLTALKSGLYVFEEKKTGKILYINGTSGGQA